MTSFVSKPSWMLSPYWGHSAFPYPSETVVYGVEIKTPTKPDKFDPMHPYYRKKASKYAVPVIAMTGIGFIGWTIYKTYFKDPTGGKWTKADKKKALKRLWKSSQGGMLGGMAFGLFCYGLISLQMYMNGLSFKKTLRYFGKQAQVATGIAAITENI